MKRRTFILASSGLGLVGIAGYFLGSGSQDVLLTYVVALNGMEEIGRKYITQSKETKPILQVLRSKLSPFSGESGLEDVDRAVINSIRNDYDNGRLCNVAGWQLSETECLLAASYVVVVNPSVEENVVKQSFENARDEQFLIIGNWGPKQTLKGERFNEQSDGHSGIWIAIVDPAPNLVVYIDEVAEATTTNERLLTSGIHNLERLDEFVGTVGEHSIHVYDDINHRKQLVGVFEVLPTPERLVYPDGKTSKSFCPITAWGPQTAKRGKVFNQQPNGNAAIWIRTRCAAKSTKVLINGKMVQTTLRVDMITASFALDTVGKTRDQYTVELFDKIAGESLTVGTIMVK